MPALVFGNAAVVLQLNQAFLGSAPRNTVYLNQVDAVESQGASAFAVAYGAQFRPTDGNYATLSSSILANLNLTAPTIAASKAAELASALPQLLAAYPTSIGQVVLNLTNLLRNLEADSNWGAAAVAFNSQQATALGHSSSSASGNDLALLGGGTGGGGTYTLTNGTDTATANVFNAPMVFTPDGSDRILSLQDEDVLTGIAGRKDNTLNATIGQTNADEGTSATVTPTLKNIQVMNLDWTGDTATVDVRYADSLDTVNINKITNATGDSVEVNNITTAAANLKIANSVNAGTDVTLTYLRGVLVGTQDVANITMDSVLADDVEQDATSSGANTEGFETVNLTVKNGVEISSLTVNEMENLIISGTGYLDIVELTNTNNQYLARGAGGGILTPASVGLRKIDASAFKGNLNIDVTAATGGLIDPTASGQKFFTVITGGSGDDVFWTDSIAADSATKSDTINGGAGSNTIKLYTGDIAGNASITNIQTLEVRSQTNTNQTVDFDAFKDAALSKVLLRSESGAASQFTLQDMGAGLASGGNVILRHSSDAGAASPTVVVNLKTDTADDTVALTVENDLNTGTTFNYTINADVPTPTGGTDGKQGVENITVNDNDTESNSLTLTENDEHTGAVTLTGGTKALTYTVLSQLYAKTVDAETQLSDLRLTVGNQTNGDALNQTIKLGQGDDILTFGDIDSLDGNDTVSDAGGTDTIRAAFSKDPTGVINLTGAEKFHIVANNNVTIDMAKASKVTELALLSDRAVNGGGDKSPVTAEPFNITGVAVTDIVTLKNTALSTLNFFADNDTDDAPTANESQPHIFNGVTLSNNTGDTLTVAINSSLDVDLGATSYALGQLTTHGVKTMTVTVGNEIAIAANATASTTTTTINNIFDRDLASFTASANGSLTLGTVSGNALGNVIKTFDVSAVKGNFTADVVALGDGAVVTLAAGKNTFNALGSAGKGVSITSFGGADTITGTAQSDTITAGSGADTVNGDRGDNVISAGSGNDTVTAKDGNNTVAFGSGTYETATINLATGLDGTKATNVFTLGDAVNGSMALVTIDSDGDGTANVTQMIAVGAGSELRVEWTGATLNEGNALLDGAKAIGNAAAAYTGDDNANFVIAGAGEATTFNGGAGNDVLIKTDAAAVTFSGGAGNDVFVGDKTVANIVTGGTGADVVVLADDGTVVANATGSKVSIADGDSTTAGWDQVFGYNTAAAATNVLDLVFTTIAGNTAAADGVNAGSVKSHAINSGVVTFDDADAFAAAVLVGTGAGQLALSAVLDYLGTNLNGTSATVGFAYDGNGDGDTTDVNDSFIIFQDGASDTVVQLVGVQAGNGGVDVAVVGTAAGANTVVIG